MIGQKSLSEASRQIQYIRHADQRGGECWQEGSVKKDFYQFVNILLTREHCCEIIVELGWKGYTTLYRGKVQVGPGPLEKLPSLVLRMSS